MYYNHALAYRPNFRRPFYGHMPKHRFGGSLASVNIRETEAAYELHLLAPGRDKEDFKLKVSDERILSISYEAKAGDEKWLHSEFHLGSFERSFKLNERVDAAGISAKYADGILVVTLPKNVDAQKPILEIAVS